MKHDDDRPPETDIGATVDGAPELKAEPPRPLHRELPNGEPFPVDALGSLLRPATDGIIDRLGVPPALAGQSVLAAACLAVQGHCDVLLPIGGDLHKRPLSCFFATQAVTGERKSGCDAEALWAQRTREATLREEYKAALVDYVNSKEAHEEARAQARKKYKDAAAIKAAFVQIGPAPLPPLEPWLLCDEPTLEGLHKQYAVGQPSVGLFSSEGGGFLGGHAMRDDTILRTATGLSHLWDGVAIRRVRGGEGSSVLVGRRLSAHLMLQPHVSGLLFGNKLLGAQGLLSRFLVVAPPTTIGTRLQHPEAPESTPALRKYFARLLEILELQPRLLPGERNALDPRVLTLSPAAAQLWRDFADYVETEMKPGGAAEGVLGLANKLGEHAARLAAVLTLTDNIESGEVGVESLDAGITLAEHYLSEARRLEGEAAITDDMRLAIDLLGWLQQWPRQPDGRWLVSLPDVYQNGPRAIRDYATAQRIVGILEGHGWLSRIAGGATVNGLRRRDVWIIVKA